MRMRIFLVVVILASTATTAQAQQVSGFVESWNTVSEESVKPQLNVYARGPLKGGLDWSAWTLTSKGWSEALVGLTYTPVKWIEVSGSLGIETADDPLRQGASVWLGKGRWALLSIHENGGSGYWYRYLGKFQATETIAVGIESRRFFGTGPYAEKKFGKVALWGTYAVATTWVSQGSGSTFESTDQALGDASASLFCNKKDHEGLLIMFYLPKHICKIQQVDLVSDCVADIQRNAFFRYLIF